MRLKSRRYLNIYPDIAVNAVYHLVQRHIVRMTVAGQASGLDSRPQAQSDSGFDSQVI